MSSTLFISDLHLSDNTPEIEDALYAFLLRERRMARLFILGDFFEYWIGDDDDTPLNRRVIKQLRAASDRGTELFLVRGNRDLALGSVFANQIGATLLGDTTVISLDGKPTLVLHGDTLCTDDIEYQKMRTILHDPAWQAEMLQRPLEERREFARGLRNASQEKADKDPANIIDVNAEAVAQAFLDNGVEQMIHGHTHRPQTHRTDRGTRIVLGDWSASKGWCVRSENGECTLESFS